MNLSVETEENSDPISKISALLEANLSLQEENKYLKKELEKLQKKYKTNISELENTIDLLRNQKIPPKEFNFENPPIDRYDSNNIQSNQIQLSDNNSENPDSLLNQKLKNAEKEIQRLNKLLSEQKKRYAESLKDSADSKSKDTQNENKYFSLLKSENDRLKKLIDQKDLELTSAETTITELKLEVSKLSILQKEANEIIPIQDNIIASEENNNLNIEASLETFEGIFEEEINRVSELSDQRNKLIDIIKKLEKVCSLEASIRRSNEEEMKKEQIRKIENGAKEKALENLFKQIKTTIQIKNNNYDDLLVEDDQYMSYDDKIIQLFKNITDQKENNINNDIKENSDDSSSKQQNNSISKRNIDFVNFDDLNEQSENDNLVDIENLDNSEILLGQLKNSCNFIRSFLKSKDFDSDAIIAKCSEIENYLKTQKPVPKIVTLFTNEPSVSEQMKTFIQIHNNSKQKIELLSQNSKSPQNSKAKAANVEEITKEYNEMIKILYNLFKAVLTVNSLLFENSKELTNMYQKVSTEKDTIQVKKEMVEKNNEERLNYISSKLSPFFNVTLRNISPSSQNSKKGQNQEEENSTQKQISTVLIEEGIENLCQQNIDLKVALKEKNLLIKKLKQSTTKIVETEKVDKTAQIEQKKKVAKLESQLSKVIVKYKQMKQKDDELISQLRNDLDEALEALKNGDRLEQELEEQKTKVTKMKEKKESYDKLYNQMKQLTSENNDLKLQVKAYESQVQRLTANVNSNLQENQKLTEKVNKIKDKKKKIKKENEELLNKNRTEISELRSRNAKLENDIKNSFDSLITENKELKEKVEQLTLDLQNINDLKSETSQKIAQANLQAKNARLQLIECQNALKMNKEVTEQQIFSMKSSFELELKKLNDEIDRCKKRFIYAFKIDNINIKQYIKIRPNYNRICDVEDMSLFELINTFISFYEPQKIYDYDKCCSLLKLNEDDQNSNNKNDKMNSPLYGRCRSIMKNLCELNSTLNSRKKELNHCTLEIDDLSHQLNLKNSDSNAYKVLKKRIISLYIKMKKGLGPQSGNSSKTTINYNPNFELDSKEFDKVLNEIEEAFYINFLKPKCLQFKLDLMRTEKMILTDDRINKLVMIESRSDNDERQKNINVVRSFRPISIVILFTRRVCELSGYSQPYYVQNNQKNE